MFETAGGLIVIHCMTAVDKENLSNIEWKHGNTTLVRWKDSAPTKWPNDKDSSEQNRIEVKDGSFALHIRLSRLLDSGTYTCIGYGNSSTNGTDEDVELFQDVTKVTVRGKLTILWFKKCMFFLVGQKGSPVMTFLSVDNDKSSE